MEMCKTFNPREYARKGLSVSEVVELKETFDLFDADHSGLVNPGHMKSALRTLGYEEKNQKIYQIINGLDQDGSDKIDFGRFLNAIFGSLTEKDIQNEVDRVFSLFDYENLGYISHHHIAKVAKELGENITGEEIREIIEKADSIGNSQITKEDFHKLMTK